jgi:predicted DNA-binding WGR domain protein
MFGVYLAWRGLRTWRRQLVGQAEYDLARRWLRAAYRLKEAIRKFRSSLQTDAEMSSAVERFKNKRGIVDSMTSPSPVAVAVYDLRWDRLSEEFNAFEAESLEAEVTWGKPAQDLRNSFQDLARELWRNMMIHLEGQKDGTGSSMATNQSDRQKADEVIYE